MENQHRKITGYRDLTEDEIDAINMVKKQGEQIEQMLNVLANLDDINRRWLAMATTDLQVGIMKAVRSIAKPESF